MKRGPAPTPTKMLEARGSWRAKTRPKEPRRSKTARPTCPPLLKGEARKEWNRITKELVQLGCLAKADRALLAAYCLAWAEYLEIEEQLKQTGRLITEGDKIRRNPLLIVRKETRDVLIKLADRFGLSPAARTRIETEVRPAEAENPKARFFAGLGAGAN